MTLGIMLSLPNDFKQLLASTLKNNLLLTFNRVTPTPESADAKQTTYQHHYRSPFITGYLTEVGKCKACLVWLQILEVTGTYTMTCIWVFTEISGLTNVKNNTY